MCAAARWSRAWQSLHLLELTVVSGMVDAVAYLALGHVFVVNMTGNVVILGLALGGAPDFTTVGCLISLVAFAVGTIISGRLAKAWDQWRLASLLAESGLLAVAAVIAFGAPTYPIIAVLALAMGMRTAGVRLSGVSDITTTVITSTLTWLGAYTPLAGGHQAGAARRLAAITLLLAGAASGAWLTLQSGAALTLAIATGIQLLASATYALSASTQTT